jgi:hypothetical protein
MAKPLVLTLLFLIISMQLSLSQTQSVKLRIYPDKNSYIVGEPIFINIELINEGKEQLSFDDGECSRRFGFDYNEVEMAATRRRSLAEFPSCFGGHGGSCIPGSFDLRPGEKRVEQIFVSSKFSIDYPGTYRIRVNRSIPIIENAYRFVPVATLEARSELGIEINQGNEAQLKAAFDPYVKDLTSSDKAVQSHAVEAIAITAPPFLEDMVVELSGRSELLGWWARDMIQTLGRINTRKTRERLVKIAEHSNVQSFRIYAIAALSSTHDPAVLEKLIQIATVGSPEDRSAAIWNAGRFGGAAIPFLTSSLRFPDIDRQIAAVNAFGATASRAAVPVLIDLLSSSEPRLVRQSRSSLAELTHFSAEADLNNKSPDPNEQPHWRAWWEAHKTTAQIFDTNSCSEQRPLP